MLLMMLLPLPAVICTNQSKHQIIVDSQTGINDSSCWEGGYSTPCFSLNLALKGVQHYNHSTIVILQPGQHQLYSGSETQLKNMSQLAIVGNGSAEGEVAIRCQQPLTGLAFFGCKDIAIQNVTVVSCGTLQDNTGDMREYSAVLEIQVAIFFSVCETVQLANVHVIKSNGTGVIFYNPVGVVQLVMCTFLRNSLSSEQAAIHGGGGLVIETNDGSFQSNCVISNCLFASNTASNKLSSPPSRGGGISIVFRGGATNNTIQLNSVHLKHNKAQIGGGIFLAFYDSANSNNVAIDGMIATENNAMGKVGILLSLKFSSGGGISMHFVASENEYPFDNAVQIDSGKFVSNTAQLGGGLAVDVGHENLTTHGCTNAGNILLIESSTFDNNIAYGQGSSAYLLNSKSCQTLVNMKISFCNFTNSVCSENTGAGLLCLGSLALSHFSLTLEGTLLFSGNSLSALSLSFSSIELLQSTELLFINNNAVDGAAINIIDCSSIIVNDCTELYFENNTASHRGGAIYAEACSQTIDSCFIRHSNTKISPDEWRTNISFYGNQASVLGDSIYANSIISCVWPNFDKNCV